MRTRFAPTPSGRLHLGNAAHALLTSWWAQSQGGTVLLRVDDVDAPRCDPRYRQDIVEVLTWLGIQVDPWPGDAQGEQRSRLKRIEASRAALTAAMVRGLPVYACQCSRRVLSAQLPYGIPTGGCPSGCRQADHELVAGESALRVAVPPDTVVDVDGRTVNVHEELGDFVIWRRDDLPAYQWFSVVDDTDAGITHILRGEDLHTSSAAQLFLARFLPDNSLLDVEFRHHALVMGDAGLKLSKSQSAQTTTLPRDASTRDLVVAWATELGQPLGIHQP